MGVRRGGGADPGEAAAAPAVAAAADGQEDVFGGPHLHPQNREVKTAAGQGRAQIAGEATIMETFVRKMSRMWAEQQEPINEDAV